MPKQIEKHEDTAVNQTVQSTGSITQQARLSVTEQVSAHQKTGGTGANCLSFLFCVLSGLFYFKIETFSLKGQANFC